MSHTSEETRTGATTHADDQIHDHIYNFGCTGCGFRLLDETDRRPVGRIPVTRIVEKLDACFARNDMEEAGRLLDYWRREAVALGDREGELSIVNEQLGYTRKVNSSAEGLEAVTRSLSLLRDLHLERQVSGATILLNAATTMKAFGQAQQAMALYDQVYEIYQAHVAPEDVRMGGYYNNRAVALCDLGRLDEAEQAFGAALSVMEKAEKGAADCAVTYANMAHMYGMMAERADAVETAGLSDTTADLPAQSQTAGDAYRARIEDCLQKAEALLEGESICRDGYYAYVCDKCASAFDYGGYFLYADTLRQRARHIYEGA